MFNLYVPPNIKTSPFSHTALIKAVCLFMVYTVAELEVKVTEYEQQVADLTKKVEEAQQAAAAGAAEAANESTTGGAPPPPAPPPPPPPPAAPPPPPPPRMC